MEGTGVRFLCAFRGSKTVDDLSKYCAFYYDLTATVRIPVIKKQLTHQRVASVASVLI